MRLSVVIPTYNGKKLLQANLPAIISACTHWGSNWEIIIVDDAGTDDTPTWLKKKYPKIKLVKNKQNLRFARSVNRGVARASGDILVLFNNDVRPEKNFLQPLLSHFEDQKVFAVGCLEKNIEAGKEVLGGRGVGRFSRGFFVHWRAKDQTKSDTLWVSGGSGAFSKKIWNKLGGFDPLYRPAYEEDRDLCYLALKAGYKLAFESNSKVSHFHETTNIKTFGKQQIRVMGFKNQILFVWKNISSPKLMLEHLLWLPYHLIFTTLRSRGLFLLGFLGAVSQIPEAIVSRRRASKLWMLTDETVLKRATQ